MRYARCPYATQVELMTGDAKGGRRGNGGPRRGFASPWQSASAADRLAAEDGDDDVTGYSYWSYDLPDRNFTSCLTLSSLREGTQCNYRNAIRKFSVAIKWAIPTSTMANQME